MSVPDSLLPQTIEEYETRFRDHFSVRGKGEDSIAVMPCPFCAAPEWHEVLMAEFRHSTSSIYCVECGRSACFELVVDEYEVERLELVHTGGPKPPEWMETVRSEVASEPRTNQEWEL